MKKIIFILLIFILQQFQVFAGSIKTWITDNNDGKIIETPEYVLVISDFDIIDTSLWLPLDDILITDDKVINLDNGEKAEIINLILK